MNISCKYLYFCIIVLSLLYLSTTAQSSAEESGTLPTSSPYFEKVFVKYDAGKVLISWPKAEKLENLMTYYSIERSKNAIHFQTIKLSKADDPNNFSDVEPIGGISYYRVRKIVSGEGQMDFSLSREFAITNTSNPAPLVNSK